MQLVKTKPPNFFQLKDTAANSDKHSRFLKKYLKFFLYIQKQIIKTSQESSSKKSI